MYKRVDLLTLTDEVVLLGRVWCIEGIRRQQGNYDEADAAELHLRDSKSGIEQRLNVTTWQEIEIKR